MILPTYLEEEVKKCCEIVGISIIKGNIPHNRLQEVKDFISVRLKKDRLATKRKEEHDRMCMRGFIEKLDKYHIESPIEEFLFLALHRENLDKYFVPQFQIGSKRVDFACPLAHLVVECDGKEYHHTDQEQIEKDQARGKYLARKGWRVLHIEGLAIRRNMNLCLEKIKSAIEPFLPQGIFNGQP